jgi:hypothetical protein
MFIPLDEQPTPDQGEPFDIPGARYSHHGGHCTFYSLLKENRIDDPILTRIAEIIDEADLVQEVSLEPAAFGLDLICRGLRQISQNDFEAMEHGRLIYEALYAQLKLDSPA